MNPNRYPLRINVGFLLNQPIGYSREIHFDCPELKLDEDFSVRNLTGLARVNRTPQGILLQGEFDGQTEFLGDLSDGVTGEVLHVDCGYSIVGL